ncbi:ABC transporter permease [Streptomyces sp. NPDC050560]|uniref:ABC transporter permease n=1 Tax=Streptomyces sp. NPDC050560 TaxID=3365630 RepID=UPI0037B2CA89
MSAIALPPHRAGRGTTPLGRMRALARAELTLLGRAKGTLFAALVVPLVLPFSVSQAADGMDLKKAGLTLGTVVLPAGIGFSMIFAVYTSLTTVYVGRREELVLKRLRTGELRDREILAGAAVPTVGISLVQTVLLAVICTIVLDMSAPPAPHLAILGIVLGIGLCACLAAVTAAFSRTAETAQVTALPLMFVSMIGSGVFVPLEVFPDTVAKICERLPLTPAITLIRAGWTGDLSAGDTVSALLTGLVWLAIAVFAVRRWFRWEPRR